MDRREDVAEAAAEVKRREAEAGLDDENADEAIEAEPAEELSGEPAGEPPVAVEAGAEAEAEKSEA